MFYCCEKLNATSRIIFRFNCVLIENLNRRRKIFFQQAAAAALFSQAAMQLNHPFNKHPDDCLATGKLRMVEHYITTLHRMCVSDKRRHFSRLISRQLCLVAPFLPHILDITLACN